MKQKYWPSVVLLLLWCLSLALLARLWLDRHGHIKRTPWTQPAPIAAVIVPVAIQEPAGLGGDAAEFAPILERPLLALDRRPPPPPAPPPPPPPPDALSGARLYGLVAGEQGAVLLRAEGRMLTLQIDKTVGDWVLKSIGDRSATFERTQESRTLSLEYTRLGAPSASQGRSNVSGAGMANRRANIGGVPISNN